jgi:hypothetical protein
MPDQSRERFATAANEQLDLRDDQSELAPRIVLAIEPLDHVALTE